MSELVFNRVILEKINRILALLATVSLGLNCLLGAGLIQAYQKPPLLVYSQEGQVSVLKTKTLQIDEAFLKAFTMQIAGQYLSFTADSFIKQIDEIRPYLAPKPADAILDSFKENLAVIKKENVSQQFIVDTVTITKKTDPFWVEVKGTRVIHALSNDKKVPTTYILEVKKVRPSQTNPYGFLMTDIIQQDKPVKKG